MVAHISIEGGKWYSGFGHEIDAMDNVDIVTLEYHRRFIEESQAEIARLQAEVERTNDVLGSQAHVILDLRAKLDVAHNSAIEAAKDLLLARATDVKATHLEGPRIVKKTYAIAAADVSTLLRPTETYQ